MRRWKLAREEKTMGRCKRAAKQPHRAKVRRDRIGLSVVRLSIRATLGRRVKGGIPDFASLSERGPTCQCQKLN